MAKKKQLFKAIDIDLGLGGESRFKMDEIQKYSMKYTILDEKYYKNKILYEK